MKKYAILALLAVISLFVLAGCTQKSITGSVVEDPASGKCVKQEPYVVQMPYEDTEYEWVEVCLDRQQYCKDTVYTEFDLKVAHFGKSCTITVKNTGDLKGDWTLRAQFITTPAGGGPLSQPITKTISPGETAKFEYTYGGSDTPSSCINSNDEVPVDKYCPCSTTGKERVPKPVTKYRTETRYRNVTVEC